MIKATPSQTAALRRICRYVHDYDILSDEYEVKTWEVTPLFGPGECPYTRNDTLVLHCETGLKGNKDVLADCMLRTTRHLFIGRNGGISGFVDGKLIHGTKALIYCHR